MKDKLIRSGQADGLKASDEEENKDTTGPGTLDTDDEEDGM